MILFNHGLPCLVGLLDLLGCVLPFKLHLAECVLFFDLPLAEFLDLAEILHLLCFVL